MDPESKELLEKTFQLIEENNKMLRKVRGVQKRQTLWSVIRLMVIIAVTVGALYYVEPYLEKVLSIFNQITGKQTLDPAVLQNALKGIKP